MEKKQMKWIYEEIVGRIPPFSKLTNIRSILLQFFLLLILGLFLGVIFRLKYISLLYGSIGILVAVLWSLLILQLGPTLRKFRAPLSREENLLLEKYKNILFHKNHYEAVPGAIIFIAIMLYLFIASRIAPQTDLLTVWLGSDRPPVLLAFMGLLIWDISYRMGLGIWTSILALWRSLGLLRLAGIRTELEHTPYTELNYLRKLDINNVFFGIISLILIPIFQQDIFIISFIIMFMMFVTSISLLSAYIISRVPWLPPDIYNLVKESNFAYIGASGNDRMPHITPVVYVFDGNRIFFNTSKEAKKLSIMKENKKVAFLIDKRDMSNIYENKALLLIGDVKIYTVKNLFYDFIDMFRAMHLFIEKYPEYTKQYSHKKTELPKAWQLTPFVSRILIQVRPRHVIYWRGAKQIKVPV